MILKKKLGLEKLTYVQIARVIASPSPIYQIFFDSYRSSMPITSFRIKKARHPVAMIQNGSSLGKVSPLTPLQNLSDYNGNLSGTLFLITDLSGSNMTNKSGLLESNVKLNEKRCIFYGNLNTLLEYTVKDFKSDGVSPLTKKHFKIRQAEGQPGLTLESIIWDETEDSLLLEYFVIPTFDDSVTVTDFKGGSSKDNHYETEVEFTEVSQYLGTKEEFLELSKGDQIKKLREMIKNSDILLHSNSPVWYWQGHFENANEKDFAIYDFQGTKGKGIWQKKHGDKKLNISKHIFSTLQVIPFTVDEISKKIREE